MQELNFSLQDWIAKTAPKKTYFQDLEKIWKKICPMEGACIAEIAFDKQELIVEVENHLLMCNLQFEKLKLLKKINQLLNNQGINEKISKLRFRLKRINS